MCSLPVPDGGHAWPCRSGRFIQPSYFGTHRMFFNYMRRRFRCSTKWSLCFRPKCFGVSTTNSSEQFLLQFWDRKKKTRLDLVRREEMLAWRLQQKFYECCGVTLMWFKGREAEMKQSVLDRNATLARDVLRRKHKKKRGQYRSSLEMRAAKKRRKKNKQIFLSNLRKQREKSKWIVWANIYFCVFPNKLQLSLQVYWVYSLILSTKLPSVGTVTFCFIESLQLHTFDW